MNNQTNTKETKARPSEKTAESAENISAMKQNQNIKWLSRHFVSGSLRLSTHRANSWVYCTTTVAPRAGKMNRISRCDWLPERARWSYLARSGYGLCPARNIYHVMVFYPVYPLLTKLVRSKWLDIGLVLFLRVYGPRLRLGP